MKQGERIKISPDFIRRLTKDINQGIEYNTTTQEHEINEQDLFIVLSNYFDLA